MKVTKGKVRLLGTPEYSDLKDIETYVSLLHNADETGPCQLGQLYSMWPETQFLPSGFLSHSFSHLPQLFVHVVVMTLICHFMGQLFDQVTVS